MGKHAAAAAATGAIEGCPCPLRWVLHVRGGGFPADCQLTLSLGLALAAG